MECEALEHRTTLEGSPYIVAVESAPPNYCHTYPPVPAPNDTERRAFRSTLLALIMAILGSSVLPVSYAFARTGIATGLAISVVVAVCNVYTCQLLLKAALATRTATFEELCAALGGTPFKAFAQASNVILLTGNLTGDLCLLADLGSKSLTSSLPGHAPLLLTAHNGRGIMLLLTAAIIFPISLFRGMRALEHVSWACLVILVALTAVLLADAIGSGFRGVASGEVPLWGLPHGNRGIAEAFALLGFSFYLHPLMMPMLQELPAGESGVRIMVRAMEVVVLGVALTVYTTLGVLGAAAFGADTKGDIMMNHLLSLPSAAATLAIAVLVYLACCIPPLVLSLRSYLDYIWVGPRGGFKWPRFVTLTVGIIVVPLSLVWHDPSVSEKAFALTGATGVCVVCYVIPVIAHFRLMYSKAADGGLPTGAGEGGPNQGLLEGLNSHHAGQGMDEQQAGFEYTRPPTSLWQWLLHVVRPAAVLAIGVSLSAMAVWQTVAW